MFSVITNIYNKKTKGPTFIKLFTATGKLKKVFFDNKRCSMYASRKHYVPPLPSDLAGTDHCSSEEYRCTHVDACVART
jgi:hypothetical protein